jgi:DNA polymerase-3 subunit delta'
MTDNWNLTGHEWAVDMLSRHVANGEARHAYLFCGPPRLGRRSLALRFAQALNCTNPPAPGQFCGECRDCRQTAAMQHPDLSIVEPTILDDKKQLVPHPDGETRISQIRELHKTINLRPYQSKYRVALFPRFQQANDNAANALLKTLEEAPAYAILLLTADTPEMLLPTIVSRCEVLRLRPLKIESVQKMLESRGVERGQARLLAHISAGRPGYAQRLLEDEKLLEARTERIHDLQSLLKSTRVKKFAYADKLAKDKDTMRQTIFIWLSYWRDVLMCTAKAETPISNVDHTDEIESLAARLTLASARRIVSDLELALERLERNVNPRLLAEVLLLDWPK